MFPAVRDTRDCKENCRQGNSDIFDMIGNLSDLEGLYEGHMTPKWDTPLDLEFRNWLNVVDNATQIGLNV
jgi:hypothetical protein